MKRKPLARREDIVAKLLREVEKAGGQKAWAESNDISLSYVNDVLKRSKPIGEKIANALGYSRVEGFEENHKMKIAKRLLTPSTVAREIDFPLCDWPGSCHQIAVRLVELLPEGCEVKRGLFTGPMPYGKYAEQILRWSENIGTGRHSWIETPDGEVIDPTRYVFEGVKPYIYHGPSDLYVAGA